MSVCASCDMAEGECRWVYEEFWLLIAVTVSELATVLLYLWSLKFLFASYAVAAKRSGILVSVLAGWAYVPPDPGRTTCVPTLLAYNGALCRFVRATDLAHRSCTDNVLSFQVLRREHPREDFVHLRDDVWHAPDSAVSRGLVQQASACALNQCL